MSKQMKEICSRCNHLKAYHGKAGCTYITGITSKPFKIVYCKCDEYSPPSRERDKKEETSHG